MVRVRSLRTRIAVAFVLLLRAVQAVGLVLINTVLSQSAHRENRGKAAGGIEFGQRRGKSRMSRSPVLLMLVASYPGCAAAAWIADVDAGFLHDSNLNNAELKRDIRSDRAVTASVSAGQFIQLDRDHSLTVTADVKSEIYHHFSGMNNIAAGATLGLRRKLGLGAAAPWLRLSGSAARLDFNEDLRDGWLYRAGLSGGKRVAERWELRAEYSFEKRTGDDATPVVRNLPGDVFDLQSHAAAFDVRYSLSEKTMFFAAHTWREGDVVSTSMPNAKIFRTSTALARDPVFGAGISAYKLDAITRTFSVGVSHAVTSRSALNLSYQRQMTHGAGDNNYFKNVFAATYAHGFF